MTDNPFIAYWYFHLPNFALAALMYMMLGRILLTAVFAPDSRNLIWRAFVRATDPVLAAIRPITPGATPFGLLLVFAALWLLLARLAFLVVLYQFGMAPGVEAAS